MQQQVLPGVASLEVRVADAALVAVLVLMSRDAVQKVLFWLLGSLAAAGLYAIIVWRAYAGLVRNFDMTLRKQSST